MSLMGKGALVIWHDIAAGCETDYEEWHSKEHMLERVGIEGFLRGRGQLVSIDHVPSPEQIDESLPYLLVTGRVLQHYNVGSMTRRTPSRELVAEDVLEMNPADVAREGLADGQRVALESRWGRTTVTLAVSQRVEPGTLFLSFHFPDTHTNRVTGPHLDPQSKCPEYKITAVRVAAAVQTSAASGG